MSKRADRLDALSKAVKEYVASEKTRIDNEVAVMQAILDGRGGGGGAGKEAVQAVAYNDLAAYLKEG
jgi:hypothetical protein